jgi:hypothetical protein
VSPKGRAAVERRKASAPCRVRAATQVAEDKSASYGVPHPSSPFVCLFVLFFVARVERSETRGGDETATSFPDFAALNPGYGRKQNSGAKKRAARRKIICVIASAAKQSRAVRDARRMAGLLRRYRSSQ